MAAPRREREPPFGEPRQLGEALPRRFGGFRGGGRYFQFARRSFQATSTRSLSPVATLLVKRWITARKRELAGILALDMERVREWGKEAQDTERMVKDWLQSNTEV